MRILVYILISILIVSCSAENISDGELPGEAVFEIDFCKDLEISRSYVAEVPDRVNLHIRPENAEGDEKFYELTADNGVFKRKSILAPGRYICSGYNYPTVQEALTTGERGSAWYFSELASENAFLVETEKTTKVAMEIGVANSCIIVQKDDEFTDDSFVLYKVAVYTSDDVSRKMDYILMDGSESAWFGADRKIMLQVFFTYNNQNYYKILDIDKITLPGNMHKITVKPSLGGTGSILISVDNSMDVKYQLVYLNVDGSVVVGNATGTFVVGADGEMNMEEGNIDFDPEL